MTPNSPLNGEIKPTCHGGTVCRARRLQHGCLTKAITAPLRLHREARPVCQCVGGYVCSYGGGREGRKRQREGDVLTGQFQVGGPDGPVWPLIPQANVQVHICLLAQANTHKYAYMQEFLYYRPVF